jgi:DNA/RNA-binding domain of Phe-tRNA-synthetase-like protein
MGVSAKEFPSSIEALLRRALKGAEPFHINPLVDFYNAISLRHTVPAGGFDLADLSGLELRRTVPGDTFRGLDTEERVVVPPGEVAYTDGTTVLTRHFVWRQSRVGLITPATRSVFLVSEILGEVGGFVAEAVCSDLSDGLVRYFGVAPQTYILSRGTLEVSWDEPDP